MASKSSFDITGLQPLDVSGLQPQGSLDVNGLEPLDATGLQPIDKEFSLDNTARLTGERAGDVAGNFIDFGHTLGREVDSKEAGLPALILGRSRETLEKAGVEPAFYLGDHGFGVASYDEKQRIRNVSDHFLKKSADALKNLDLGGDETQQRSWDEVKDSPISNVLPFIIEQGLVSTPDMLAAIYATPAYVTSRSQEIGGERAVNDGREEPTVEDVVKAAPAAVASAILERFGGRGMLGLDEAAVQSAKQILPEVGKAALKEGATEFGQSIIENAGATVGTERGFDMAEALDEGFAGSVAGTGFGGIVRGSTATGELVLGSRPAPSGETDVDGQPLATVPDNVSDADIASPIPTDVISEGRAELDAALNHAAEPVADAASQAPVAPQQPELETLFDMESGEAIGQYNTGTGETILGLSQPATAVEPEQAPQPVPAPQKLPHVSIGNDIEFDGRPMNITAVEGRFIIATDAQGVPTVFRGKKDFEAKTGHTFEGFTAARGAIPKRPPSLVELLRKQGIRKDDAKAQGVDLDGKLPKHLAQVFSNNPKTLTLDQVGERLSEMGLLPQGNYDLSDVVELVNQDLLAHRNKDMSQAVVPAADVVDKVARQEYEARQFELGELADLSYSERAKQLRQQYESAPAVGDELTQAEIEAAFDLDNYRASYFDENDAAERAAMEAYYRGQDNDGAGRPGHGEQADTRNRSVSGNPAGSQDGRRGSQEAGRNASLEGSPAAEAASAAELDPFDLSQPIQQTGNLSEVGQKELSKIQANAVIEAGLAVEGSPLQAITKKARAGKMLSKTERSTLEEAFVRKDKQNIQPELNELEQRAAAVYEKVLQQGYNGDLPLDDYRRPLWREQMAEQARNPRRYSGEITEHDNAKGLKIGDEVIVKSNDPSKWPDTSGVVTTVRNREYDGKTITEVHTAIRSGFGGWADLSRVDKATAADSDGQTRVPGSERTDEKEQAANRAEAEMRARQQQSKIRRGGQESLADQDGGLFSAERDQGNLFDTSGLQELKSDESKKEDANVSGGRTDLERDSRDTGSKNGLGEADLSASRRGSEQSTADGRTAADSGSRDSDAGRAVSDADAAPLGERGDRGARRQQSLFDDGTTERDERGRGDTDGGSGQAENDAGGKDPFAPNADEAAELKARADRQAKADTIKVKPADAANIRETLPLLLEDQQTDVLKAETRFNNPDALPGYLFTNGTGTGKTYVGAGVVKRYARQGKDNILIVAPSQGILQGWVEAGQDLGLNITVLDDTKSKGKGIVATTYANLGENPRLAERNWDLVVNDESQELSKNERGDPTLALNNMRAITNRGRSGDRYQKARMLLADKWAPYFELRDRARALKGSKKKADKDLAEKLMFKAQELATKLHPETKAKADSLADVPRTDVLFLSATPFAYDKNIDYAEGYLFEYGSEKEGGRSYNEGGARDQFFMQHFGYRMRYNKLTRPENGVDSEVMEREFHEWLKKEGALSGRRLEVDADYDRKFVLVDDAVGAKIDQALEFLREADKGKFRDLADLVNKRFDYLTRMKLLEAIKARHAVPIIKKHLALGRKVVVFHDYNVGGGINPFVMPADEQVLVRVGVDGTEKEISLQKLYAEFIARNPYAEKLNFASFRSPINEIRTNFEQALIYNGKESTKARNEAKRLFNDDQSGHDVILVQSAAGEAGISLHDAKKGKQRALINLGMPTRPTTAIQEEGRIYRTGQTSDAIFRYMNTGTSWERWTFAQKIAERASTAENLALGNEARALKQSFIDAFIDSDVYEPTEGEGKGGKELDYAARDELSGFERAKTFYWAQQKKSGRRDQREGQDYYATPEPIGFKMVELADIKRGERILEPSAGHGAIARFFPEDTDRTIVEPSSELASKAAIVSAGANAKNHTFEELNVRLKYDAVVMNPPYGMGGKVAMDHLAKAMKHTKNGGRVVALIPTGPAADKRFDALYESKEAKAFHLVADIKLPSATFTRAGTSVMTRIVVLEKQSDSTVAQSLQSIQRDYTDAATVEDLFDRIESLELSERKDPITQDADEIVPGEPFQIGDHTYSMRLTSHDLDGSNYVEWAKYPGRTEHARLAAMAERMNGHYYKSLKAFSFDSVEDAQAWITEARKPVSKGEVTSEGVEGVTFDTGETTHSKTGQDLYVASFQTRHDMDVFVTVREIAKKHDGYYSKFRGRGAIPGFQFKTEEQRQAFMDEVTQGAKAEEKFKLQDDTQTEDTPRELSGLSKEAKKQLENRFRQLGLDAHAGLFFVKEIATAVEGQKLSANGRFIRLDKDGAVYRFIEIAEDAPDAQHTLDHETIHVLRSIGAFRKSEWTALTKAAKKDRELMARIDRLYGGQGLSQDAVMEEAAAEMFADWSRDRSKYTGFIRKAFERVRAILDAIREAITGSISAQTVMERVERGETAKRKTKGREATTENKLQAFDPSRDRGDYRISEQELEELGEVSTNDVTAQPIEADSPRALRLKLKGYLRDFRGEYLNKSSGISVRVSGNAIDKATSGHISPAKSAALSKLGYFLENAVIYQSRPTNKGGDNVVNIHRLAYPVVVNGDLHSVKLTLKEHKQHGDRFYTLDLLRTDQMQNPTPEGMGFAAVQLWSSPDGISDRPPATINMGQFIRNIKFDDVASSSGAQIIEKLQPRASDSLLNTDFGQPIRSMVEEMHRTHLPVWQRIRNASSRLAVREQFDRLRHVMQDAMLPVFRLQGEIERATGKPIGEALDVYQKETLYSGRVGARFEQLVDNHLEPLMETLKAKGVTMEELEAYLYARHAKERNAYIAEINPEFEDGAGSGMSDAEAEDIMKAVKAAGKERAMKDLAARVDKVLAESLQARVDDGLLSQDEALALKKRWKHYVPLRGEAEIDPDQSLQVERPRTSAGQSVKGKEYQQAFGRKTKAAEIIPYIFMQAQEGIIRGEKNRVAKTFHNLAVNNPNSDFWTVKKITRKPYLDKKTGQVVYRVQPIAAEDADFTVSAKLGGKVVRVILNRHNPAAVRLAAAMRNLDGEKMGHMVQWLSTATRFLSAINTSFNPEFVVSNALRDLETGLALSGQFDVKGMSKKILKSWIPAIIGAEQGAFKRGNSEWKRWFDEYTAAGGRVYFNTMEDVQDTRKKLQRMFKEAGPGMHPLKPLRALGDTIQKVNLGVESAIRLSLYRHLRENGFSKDRAAVAAKELTVNFNRKGTMGPTLNAFYMFYNAGIQGTFTLLTAAKRSRKVRQALGGLVLAGAFLEIWNQLFSPEDEDGEKAYDKLSEFEKSRNFIFYIPGSDRPIEFPAGYGLNFFLHAGRASVEMASGKDKTEALSNLGVTALEAFNPIGGAGSAIKQLSPTVIDPLVELELNEDFAGRQIYPNSPYDDFTPDSQRAFSSVSPFAEALAEGMNELTGGSNIEPGLVDVSPESIEHLFTFVTGSSGRFYQRLADLPMKLVDPSKDVTENDIPFLRKVVGPSDFTWKNRERFYERTEAIERAWTYFNDYRKSGDNESAAEFLEENRDILAMRDLARKVKRDLSKLRRVRLALQESKEKGSVSIDEYAEQIQPVRDAEKSLINSFNKAYVDLILNKDGD